MAEIFEVITPILLITLIGYFFGRSKVELHSATLSTTVIMVAMPSLVFSSLTSLDMTLQRLFGVLGAAALCMTLSFALSYIVVRALGFSVRTFLPSLLFPNSGNMGLPLVFIAFGDVGLSLAVAYFVLISLTQHTVGVAIASGQYSIGSLLRQPLIYAVFAVFGVMLTRVTVPTIVATTTELLGGMMIPAMLILLGNSLAKLKVSDFMPAFAIAVGRLVIGASAAIATIWLLGLTGMLAGVVFMLSTMPAAVMSYVYAERFQRDPEKIAGAVVLSTVLTFAALPGVIWIAKQIALH